MGYKFSVEQSYSGVSGTQVEVFTGQGFGDCGHPFRTGVRYLVYAYRNEDKLTTSICTRTRVFESAGEDVAFLGTLSSRASGVTINGEVRTSSAEGKFVMSDASITIESDTQRREVRPNAEGEFRVSGLSPGKIKVSLKLPEKFAASNSEQELTVSDRGCANVDWFVTDNGRINGRVVDADGLPVTNILVSLEDPPGVDSPYVGSQRTGEEGKFTFSAVPQGRYLLTVNRTRHPDPSDPNSAYAPTFYPGVSEATDARVITVGIGEKVSDLEVRVAKRAASIVEGSVVWPDGLPVANAFVRVKDRTNKDALHRMNTDELGQFKLYGYVGQQLIIEARLHRPDVLISNGANSMDAAGQVTITLERANEPVRIVLRKLR